MSRLGRRSFGLLAAGLGLQGCGFRPVYAPDTGGGAGAAEIGLGETEVQLIPERLGQLLREALQARFERAQASGKRRYDLQVAVGLSAEGIGIQRDNSTSRVRLVGTATWRLMSQAPQPAVLLQGVTREVDAYNVIDQQYFASDMQSEAVQRRMMDALAEKLTLQLAAGFRQKASSGSAV